MSAGAIPWAGKAAMLELLVGALRHGRVLPQLRVTLRRWQQSPHEVRAEIAATGWLDSGVAVRSSAAIEDGATASQAGHFQSVLDVVGPEALHDALTRVASSLEAEGDGAADEILIQPMLRGVWLSAVAFGRDPNGGGPYDVINYELGPSTDGVTSGRSDAARLYVHHHEQALDAAPEALQPVLRLMGELRTLLGTTELDVELAITDDALPTLLQVRRLCAVAEDPPSLARHGELLGTIARRIERAMQPHPYLCGRRTLFGVMPDWNPAEIIGVRPRPLALTLYRELITDATWAYQRDNYGYRNLRSFPLMVSFHGLPYVDVRVSFNSFIPADLPDALAERLVEAYLDRLRRAPALHDKVEFEVILSCYTLDLPRRLEALRDCGFEDGDLEILSGSLRRLTNRIVHPETGLWRQDLEKVRTLQARRETIAEGALDPVSQIYWLIEDCKRHGTLPFAGLARAGFIAVQLLRSLVHEEVLSEDDYDAFMASLRTVSTAMTQDLGALSREAFLARYGHLRPGTYDINSPRYDQAPDAYFDFAAARGPALPDAPQRFRLDLPQMRAVDALMRRHGIEQDVLGLFDFIQSAIEGRELAKFIFTRSLSDVLEIIARFGESHGLSRDDMSYLELARLRELYTCSDDAARQLREGVRAGRRRHAETLTLNLPPLITEPGDVMAFHLPAAHPNFITRSRAQGEVARPDGGDTQLQGRIVAIPSADPGYDWIFSHGIAGFVTQFGGANSHMAIRAGELDIPAVIGAGQALYGRWSAARRLALDCSNQKVQVLA